MRADGDRARLLLSVAEHQHVGELGRLGVVDLLAHRLGALVHLHAYARLAQLRLDLGRIRQVAVRDWQDRHLHRRQPDREPARVVLDQDADEPLHRAEQRSVDHHRAVLGVVGPLVAEIEALGHLEVELAGAALP